MTLMIIIVSDAKKINRRKSYKTRYQSLTEAKIPQYYYLVNLERKNCFISVKKSLNYNK